MVENLITKPHSEIIIHDGPLPDGYLNPSVLRSVDHGAISSFVGIVRNNHFGRGVTHIDYQCYRDMAEQVFSDLFTALRKEFDPDAAIFAAHGSGHMVPGDCAVALHVASAHRDAACKACRWLIETIKKDLPVWKQEFYDDGSHDWLPGS